MRRMAATGAQRASMASSEILHRRGLSDPFAAAIYLAPAFVVYGLFVLWPLLRTIQLAFEQWNGYGPETFVGTANFGQLRSDPSFRTSLVHSGLWYLVAATLLTILGLAVALLMARTRGRHALLAVLFFPALLPATVVAAVWTLVYSPLSGLLNTLLRDVGLSRFAGDWLGDPHLALGALLVAWIWSVSGVGALIFSAGLSAIGREYLELALMEGAGAWWRFRHVILPGLRRVGLVVIFVNIALATQVFDLIFVITGGGPGYATMIVPVDVYGRAFGGRTGQGAAAACIQLALGLLLIGLAAMLLRGGESLNVGDAPNIESERKGGTVATLGAAALLCVLLLPLGWLVRAAIEHGRVFSLGGAGPGWDPRTWDWGNLVNAWNAGMGGAMLTSLLLAVGAVLLTLLLAAPTAYALSYLVKSRVWQAIALAVLLAGLLQPTAILIIPLFFLLKDLGLLDSAWGILLPETARSIPFAVLLLWGFLIQSPRDVVEAAQVDGASPFQQMVRIALPLARPAVYAVAIWAFVTSWNEYLLPTLVSQDGSLQTVPTLLASFVGKYDTQYGSLAAGALMAMAPSLAIYLALRRPVARGITRAGRNIT
jgi:raffinose/stachyose/melibiose transport system permease protein